MGRTVSALVTWGEVYLGAVGPFPVSVPWWSEVEPVVAYLREVLDVPVLVLRLLLVEGGEGGRDGHVTYHVAAFRRPAPGLLAGPLIRRRWPGRRNCVRRGPGWKGFVSCSAGRRAPLAQRAAG